MPKKTTDEAKKSAKVEKTSDAPVTDMPVAQVTPEVPHDTPSPKEMKDLNAELAKEKPTEPGLTGYLRARIKAGK